MTIEPKSTSVIEGQDRDLLRLLVEGARDYAIFMLDAHGHILTWNAGAQLIKGYEASEIIGQHFSKFYPEEAIAKDWPAYELRMASEEGRFEDEGWRLRKDGSRFWANVVIRAVRNSEGELTGFAKITRDMTERRLWEEEIRGLNASLSRRVDELDKSNRIIEERTEALRNLSSRLLVLQDEDRRRVARELHEGLSQDLSAMSIILHAAMARQKFDPETKAAVDEGLELAEKVSKGLRTLSYILHPPLLDEAGLRSALPWLTDSFSKTNDIAVSVQFIPADFPRLSSEIETAVFRIVQEALANVHHHSGSATADVKVERMPDRVCLQVRDYGKGIAENIQEKTLPTRAVGISGMRERTLQLGGDLTIRPAHPGTFLEAWFPTADQSVRK